MDTSRRTRDVNLPGEPSHATCRARHAADRYALNPPILRPVSKLTMMPALTLVCLCLVGHYAYACTAADHRRALLVAKMSVWDHLGLYLGLLVEARILSPACSVIR